MTGSGNWTYFMSGRFPVLIDAGVGQPAHLDAIASARGEGPQHVLVSHAHGDHISGVEALRSRWPETQFSKFPWPGRDEKYGTAWQPLEDGAMIPAGDGEIQVVHTPGHAPDHLAFWHEPSRTLFSADLVVPGTTVVILASSGGSLSQYLHSLKRVLALKPARLLPAHGDPINDPGVIITRYLEHRRHRELQVLSALEGGLDNINAIVEHIYVGLADALVPMARESVLAHLIKLQDDGLARRDGDVWRTAT